VGNPKETLVVVDKPKEAFDVITKPTGSINRNAMDRERRCAEKFER
jgi:hypothetical protein